MAGAGDLRAWDGMVGGADWRIGVEAETRVGDWQALERRISLKSRDGSVDGVILLVWATRGNLYSLRALGDAVRSRFPVQGNRALELLGAGANPGGSVLITL